MGAASDAALRLDITDEPVARAVDHLAARHLSTGAVGVTAPYSGT